MNKTITSLIFLCALIPAVARAQTVPTVTTSRSGTREFTIAANGVGNKDLNDSFGGLNLSLGAYNSENFETSIRQSVNYANPKGGGSSWNGSTRLALDMHFGGGALRPFLGLNVGGIYGDTVRDTFAAGLEGGFKMYVQPRTFVFILAEYDWSFRHARSINDRFDDGQFNWGAGVGYNF